MANSVTTALQGAYTDMGSNVVGRLTPAQLTAKYSGLTLKTPTKNFSLPYQGQHIAFEKGHPVMCDAALLAALAAASAPVV